jgi:hypothetical protein
MWDKQCAAGYPGIRDLENIRISEYQKEKNRGADIRKTERETKEKISVFLFLLSDDLFIYQDTLSES